MNTLLKTVGVAALAIHCSACDAFFAPNILTAETNNTYTVEDVAQDINVPWGMVQLPNKDILVTNRSGSLHVIKNGKLQDQPVSGLPPIHVNGQGGLLDIALHPAFAENQWLYFTFSSEKGEGEGSHTALMRGKYDAEKLAITQQELLYKAEGNTNNGRHYGSRIAFDQKGYVYFSIGDRGNRDVNPQQLQLDGGKIYRLHDDGQVPSDNPFVDKPQFSGAKAAIYSYGHRNPQGLARHPKTGEIWSHEHGPRGGDEINLIRKGLNYGWPLVSYGVNYSGTKFTDLTEKAGTEQPLHHWTPSIAPSDMVFVTSERYPQWQGKLLVGSLKFNYVVLVDISDNAVLGQHKLFEDIGRVRSLLQGVDGYIYVGVDGGSIKRILPKK